MPGLAEQRRLERLTSSYRALDKHLSPSGLETTRLTSPGSQPLAVHGCLSDRGYRGLETRVTEYSTDLTIYRVNGLRKLTSRIATRSPSSDDDGSFINGYSDKIDSARVIPRSRNRSKSGKKRKVRAS